ncbi:MAG: AMP-binding protein [Spirochaetes bacterium]|nr:AMP-binding protein [Brevinematales bacterium]MCL1958970.1 AMP-binding protein [Spirochaetota bacterium]
MWIFSKFNANIAIIEESGEKITYAELQTACEALVSKTCGRSVAFNFCINEKGSLLGYVAFINGGIVPVMLDAALDRGLVSSLIENYKPDYLWLPQNMSGEFSGCSELCSVWGYTLLKTAYNRVFPLYKELALLLTTSGSTGSPKFVRQSYANIQANTESIVEYLRLDASERPVTTLPMSYTYGLSIINSHLWAGASIIFTQKTLMQKEFWQQFKDYGATSFGGVPYIYEMLEKLRFFRMDLPVLRTMTQAGGKLSPELHKKFAEYAQANGKKFVVMYGQTEATARMSYLPAEKSLEKYGSMGIAIPGGEFSLIDVDGNVITEPEVVGELVYKGANVTLGYAESGADLIKSDERGGVLVTGDMAKRDEDGFYYIVGRKKRFLKIFGSRVNLDETEQLLNGAFEGLDCACGGIDDKMTVFISDAAASDKVIKFLTEKTKINHVAFKIAVIDKIPRSEAGKILYSELNKIDHR